MDLEIEMSDIHDMDDTFQNRVSNRIIALGTNAAKIARRMGKNNSFVYDIISGRKSSVNGRNLEMLAQALECNPAWLLTGDGDPKQENDTLTLSRSEEASGDEWDHNAFMKATEQADELIKSVGAPSISLQDYTATVRRFYLRIKETTQS